MTVWLLRHGEAEPRATRDAERRLTERGEREVQAVAAVLEGRAITRIYVSPYVRAQETAAIIAARTGFNGTLDTVEWLTPNTPAEEAFDNMQASDDGDVLFVAHQPLLGALACLLVHGDVERPLALDTAALVELEAPVLSAGGMELIAIH